MRRKKNNGFMIGAVALCIVVLVAVGVYISQQKDDSTISKNTAKNVSLYFMDSTQTLKSEARDIKDNVDNNVLAAEVLKELKGGPKTEGYTNAIPATVEIKTVSVDEAIATVDLSEGYRGLKSGEELICRTAIVYTLTALDFIEYVQITIEGSPLTKQNGQEMGKMSRDKIVVDAEISPEPKNIEIISLYFANEQATALAVEEREVEVNPNQPLEKYVVEQLIAGPKISGMFATVPAETKIRDIKTVDGICYVDFSAEFVSKHGGGSTGELLTIYSIVNSLTELSTVNKVQFLIEGEKQNEFKGHVDFSKPFEAKYDISF